MTRLVLFFLGVVLMVTGGGLSAAAAEQTLFLEAKLKSANFGDMGTRRMWTKGGCMRWESMTKDLKMTLVKNSNGVFLMHPWKKMAAKYPAGTNRDNPATYLPGPVGPTKPFLAAVNAKRTGSEKVGSQMCDIYSYQAVGTKLACKLWVSQNSGKPVKLVLPGEKAKKTDTITAVYTKFELGAKVNESQFQLPKGYEVRPMPVDKAAEKKAA